jgi:hypothetical protein
VEELLHCNCGFVARGADEEALAAAVRRHAHEMHGMTLSREEALLLAFRARLDGAATTPAETAARPHGPKRLLRFPNRR